MEFISESCLALTGYAPPEELRHNRVVSYAQLIHPADRKPVWDEVQAALRARWPFQN